jgi:hypothetical protein
LIINGIYKDKNGTPLSIGNFIVKEDSRAENVKLYRIDFSKKEAALILVEIISTQGLGIIETDYDIFGEMFNIPENCVIDSIFKLEAKNQDEAYEKFMLYLSKAANKPINIRLLKKENPELYYTLLTLEAVDVEEVELEREDDLFDSKYIINKEEDIYRVEIEIIYGNTKNAKSTKVLYIDMD